MITVSSYFLHINDRPLSTICHRVRNQPVPPIKRSHLDGCSHRHQSTEASIIEFNNYKNIMCRPLILDFLLDRFPTDSIVHDNQSQDREDRISHHSDDSSDPNADRDQRSTLSDCWSPGLVGIRLPPKTSIVDLEIGPTTHQR